jgi:hypothetical protein
MLNFKTVQLMHLHDERHAEPMAAADPHEAPGHDQEREWLRGSRVFRCDECNVWVAVMPAATTADRAGPAD